MVAIVELRNPAAKNHPKIRFNARLKKTNCVLLSESSNLAFCNDGYICIFLHLSVNDHQMCDSVRQLEAESMQKIKNKQVKNQIFYN